MSSAQPDWRDEAASTLAAGSLSYLGLEEPVLVMGDRRPEAFEALAELGLSAERWSRRAYGGAEASPWPPDGPFGSVLVRLPKSREELEMTLHAGLARLRPAGRIVVYGANDEGARSAASVVAELTGGVHTVATGSRCRVIAAARPSEISGLRGAMEDWRLESGAPVRELSGPWVSWPGIFAHGRLDEGTALLLEHLPRLTARARALDFGCGSGVVGAVARARGEDIRVTFLDVDALALRAVEENVPRAETVLGEGVAAIQSRTYDAVLSNPPYHRAKAETVGVVRELAESAPGLLEPGGVLVLVTQRRLPTGELLRASFGAARELADRGPYRVWEAHAR